MESLDLRPFGFPLDIEVHGSVEGSWCGGDRLVFLFGENHRDREMKRLNVENACRLVDAGVVGCAATEVPLDDLGGQSEKFIEARSRELFSEHRTDGAVTKYLSRSQPCWYGVLEFGNTLKALRPSLPVRCVEDMVLRERMMPISMAYTLAALGAVAHPSPDHLKLSDHPLHLERERAMIDNLLGLWASSAPARAAILNTGSDHCRRIAGGLRERGSNYIHLSIPASPSPY